MHKTHNSALSPTFSELGSFCCKHLCLLLMANRAGRVIHQWAWHFILPASAAVSGAGSYNPGRHWEANPPLGNSAGPVAPKGRKGMFTFGGRRAVLSLSKGPVSNDFLMQREWDTEKNRTGNAFYSYIPTFQLQGILAWSEGV